MLPECLDDVGGLLVELVGAREGEAPLYAETVSAADGSFELEGLPEGDFTLWALGERGAELRPGVKAGAQDVELVLEGGVTLEGSVVDPEDHPLPDVQVTILRERHTRFFDTRSGPDGRFRVGPLPKGDYGLVAASEGWVPRFVTHEHLEALEWKVVLSRSRDLMGRVLRDGAPAPGVEVAVKAWECQTFTERKLKTSAEGRFTLEQLAPCTYDFTAERDGQYAVGQYTLSSKEPSPEVVLKLGEAFHVEGTVWDDARRPVAGAVVRVSPRGDYVRSWESATDARGHYRIGPLGEGSYDFDISSPGHLDHGEVHRLSRDTGPVDLALKRSILLAGRVVDEAGRPLPDIKLSMEVFGRTPEGHGSYPDFHATSDAEGRFALDAPEAGTWELEAGGKDFLSRSLSVQAPDEDVRVVLHRGATVVGTVTDSHAVPREGVYVALWKAEEAEILESASTDAQGRFSLRGLKPGRFMVEATQDRDGVDLATAKPVELQGSEQVEVALSFEEGRVLSGVVEDGHGQPVADAFIHAEVPAEATPSWRRDTTPYGTRLDGEVRTGPDGRFTLRHLAADTHELFVRKEGYTFVPARSLGGEDTRKGSLRVGKETSEVRIALERRGRITGRLVGPEGAPLRSFSVNQSEQEEPGGLFEVPFGETGVERLEFSAPDLAPMVRSVEVREGVDVNLGDVRMVSGRRVTGRVLDAETGAPLAKVQLRVEELPTGSGRRQPSRAVTTTREDGTFELSHVEERPLMLAAYHPDYRVGRVPLEGSGESVTLRLETGAWIEATVRDAAGKPVRAQVLLKQEDGTGHESITIRDGRGVGAGLEPGLYVARANPHDPRSKAVFVPQQVRIPASGRVVLNFQERKEGVTLVLRVEDAGERTSAVLLTGRGPLPVSEKTLELWADGGLYAQGEKGVVTFQYLPPGHATVLVLSSSLQFHVEELELPAEGVVERAVHPRWQPLPEDF